MIDDLREEIDKIDEEILKLLSRRGELALEIGQKKKEGGQTIKDRNREETVLSRAKKKNTGPYSDDQIERIFQTLIEQTRTIQQEG